MTRSGVRIPLPPPSRRSFLLVPALFLVGCTSTELPAPEIIITDFDSAGHPAGTRRVPQLRLSKADWRARLTLTQFYSTREGSTDTPFSGTYFELHTPGLYRCVCCSTALFHSSAKYDSGTGWPSFTGPVTTQNIRTLTDTSPPEEQRTEVRCALCDGHLGHVFPDGPPPAGLRYCINESALVFQPA